MFTHSLHIFMACATHTCSNEGLDGQKTANQRMSPVIQNWITAQQRDARQQDDSDRRQLAHRHLSDSLCSLTREQNRQRTAQCCTRGTPEHHALPFYLIDNFHVLSVRHMMLMNILSRTLSIAYLNALPHLKCYTTKLLLRLGFICTAQTYQVFVQLN